MDLNTLLVVLIPSVLSSAVALTSLILNIMREKKNKKERIWNTAKEIALKAVTLKEDSANDAYAEEIAAYFNHVYKCLSMIEFNEDFEKFLQSQSEKRSK